MRKNIISEFCSYSKDLVARNAERAKSIIGKFYLAGNSIVATIPAVDSGFAGTLVHGQPDWHMLSSAYLNDPLPLAASVIFVTGSALIMKGRFALGHALTGIGGAILTTDYYHQNEIVTALTIVPGVIGASFGALYRPLESLFKKSRPKKMAGIFMSVNSGATLAVAATTGKIALCVACANWLAGNSLSWFLPRDDQQPEQITRPKTMTCAKRDVPRPPS